MSEEERIIMKRRLRLTIIPMMIYQVFMVIPQLVIESLIESIVIPFKVLTDQKYLENLITEIEYGKTNE